MSIESKVFEKLFTPDKLELASQRIELAKKPISILAEVKKADDTLRKNEAKIESIYLSYKKAYNEFQLALNSALNSVNSSEKDLLAVMDGITALGLDAKEAQKIEGFTAASDLINKIQQMIPSFRNLYVKPE